MKDLDYMDPKVKNLIRGAIRKGFKTSEIRQRALDRAISSTLGPRGGKRYDCAHCALPFDLASVDVDHINPVVYMGSNLKEMTLEEIYKAVWTDDIDNLQVLCKSCHDQKTKKEAAERKRLRQEKIKFEKKKGKKK